MPEQPDTPEPNAPAPEPAPLSMDERPTPKWAQAMIDGMREYGKSGKPFPDTP